MVFKSKQPLKFSKFLKSKWLTDVKDHKLKKPTIVVNISNTDAMISGPEPRKVLPPRKSTILQGNDTAVMITIRYIGSLIHEFHTGSVEAIVAWHSGTCFNRFQGIRDYSHAKNGRLDISAFTAKESSTGGVQEQKCYVN